MVCESAVVIGRQHTVIDQEHRESADRGGKEGRSNSSLSYGIDSSQIDGRAQVAARTSASTRGLVVLRQPTLAEVRNGLPASFLDRLKDALEVTETQLASVVGIARQTLGRRRSQGVLRRDEGDRAATVAKVYNAALPYFDGNREHALDWLMHPSPALVGETPLERADTATGAEDVIDLIGRLEHGIPT